MAFVLVTAGRQHPIGPGGVHIGRGAGNNIVLSDSQASRRHATAWVQTGQLYIRDENSANGTWVNGQRISALTPLRAGDQVRIGGTVFEVAGSEPALAVPVPPSRLPRRTDFPVSLVVSLGIIGAVVLILLVALLARYRGVGTGPLPTATFIPTMEQSTTLALSPTATEAWSSTSTSTPTLAPAEPTWTPTPMPTHTPTSCLSNATFVQDVSVPDGTEFTPGESFTKIWRMRSSGCVPWPTDSRWVFVSGERMGAPDGVAVLDTPLGTIVDIAVQMQSPTVPGTYRGYWQMQTPDGWRFGDRAYVMIVVSSPSPAPDARPTVSILIINDTGEDLYLTLSGPAEYSFTISPGNHTIQVVPGSYSYTGRGCGGATKSGIETLTEATPDWRWWCESW